MKNRITFYCFFLFSMSALAGKSELNSIQQVNAEIKFGDKVTNYKLWKDEKTYNYSFQNSSGEASTGQMTEKDFKFLVGKIESAKELSSNERRFCPTKYIKVMLDAKPQTEKFACIASKTKISTRLTEVANILKFVK